MITCLIAPPVCDHARSTASRWFYDYLKVALNAACHDDKPVLNQDVTWLSCEQDNSNAALVATIDLIVTGIGFCCFCWNISFIFALVRFRLTGQLPFN